MLAGLKHCHMYKYNKIRTLWYFIEIIISPSFHRFCVSFQKKDTFSYVKMSDVTAFYGMFSDSSKLLEIFLQNSMPNTCLKRYNCIKLSQIVCQVNVYCIELLEL